MDDNGFEEWFNEEYPLPSKPKRGPVSREFKKGCEEAYKVGYDAGSNAGYEDGMEYCERSGS